MLLHHNYSQYVGECKVGRKLKEHHQKTTIALAKSLRPNSASNIAIPYPLPTRAQSTKNNEHNPLPPPYPPPLFHPPHHNTLTVPSPMPPQTPNPARNPNKTAAPPLHLHPTRHPLRWLHIHPPHHLPDPRLRLHEGYAQYSAVEPE